MWAAGAWLGHAKEGAQAVLCALKLGLRAGEIVGQTVRDVDAGERANAARRVNGPPA